MAETKTWEVVRKEISDYARLRIGRDDVVLDVGAHVGLFSERAVRRGARRVIAVEPDPRSYRELCWRCKPLGVVTSRRAVAAESGSVSLWLHERSNLSSTVRHRGRREMTVSAVGLMMLLSAWRPSVVKIDIEGAEHQLDVSHVLPPYVHDLAIEWHVSSHAERASSAEHHAHLQVRGWRALNHPRFDQGWPRVVIYQR